MKQIALLAASLSVCAGAAVADPLHVVVTFPVLGDFVQRVGGDGVTVTSLVGAGADAHVYEPTPADAGVLARADLIVVNGLGFEGFIDRLIAASGSAAPVVVASEGVTLQEAGGHDDHDHHDHGDDAPDPHAFQSIDNALIYIDNITQALCGLDAENCATYQARQGEAHAEFAALNVELQAALTEAGAQDHVLLVPHNAFAYFGAAYGLTFEAPQGLSTESEPSAADLAALLRALRDEGAAAAFPVSGASDRLVARLAAELSIPLGAPLYAENFSAADGPAADFIAMQRHNVGAIIAALQGE